MMSSEEQRERETIGIQREFLRWYRTIYGLDVSGVYEDDGGGLEEFVARLI